MTNARPGWYPDWERTDHVRWWDGRAWTTFVAPVPAVPPPPPPTTPPPPHLPPSRGPVAPRRSARTWLWAAVGVSAILLSLVFPPLMMIVATTTLITAIVALAKRRPTWLRLRSRGVAATVTAISAAVLLVAGSVSAATLPTPPGTDATKAVPFAAPAATDAAVTTPSPTPTPTPVTTTKSVTVTQPIPFKSRTISDPTLAKGTSRLKTAGVRGLRTLTYSVTLVDGKEVSRVLASNVVTHQPVAQVTAVGTYVAPPPPRQAAPRCDPNYAGGCVPIASDVDCAGGSGNGPAYFSGTARVVGRDIYDLDRDGDGIACDR